MNDDSLLMSMIRGFAELTNWHSLICAVVDPQPSLEEFEKTVALVADELACQQLSAARCIYTQVTSGVSWKRINEREFWRDRELHECMKRTGLI